MIHDYKFKAWHKLAHQICDIDALDWMLDSYRAHTGRMSGSGHLADIILMQWTGLKDRNGVEIYSGYIVKTENEQFGSYPCPNSYLGVVTYLEDSYHIVQSHSTYKPTLRNLTIMSIEIIGNKYEHPHLLESEITV